MEKQNDLNDIEPVAGEPKPQYVAEGDGEVFKSDAEHANFRTLGW